MSNIILKEHYLNKDTFMGAWYIHDFISDDLIHFYKNNKKLAVPGHSYHNGNKGTHNKIKQSLDIPISSKMEDYPFFAYRIYLQQCMDNYIEKYKFVGGLDPFNINQDYNLQYYPPGGGFKTWHSERINPIVSKRVFVFMTYLNDVEDGGTDFYYQKLTTPAKKGLTLIWPSEWTHTHKGQISKTQEKYIVTGWYSYNE